MKTIFGAFYIYNEYPDSLMKNRFNLIDLNNLIYRHEMYEKIFNSKDDSKYIVPEVLFFFYYIIKIDTLVKLIKNNAKIKNSIKKILINFLNKFTCSKNNRKIIKNFLTEIN